MKKFTITMTGEYNEPNDEIDLLFSEIKSGVIKKDFIETLGKDFTNVNVEFEIEDV